MHQIIKRLVLIKSSIELGDMELIPLQILKLKKFNIDNEVKNILYRATCRLAKKEDELND